MNAKFNENITNANNAHNAHDSNADAHARYSDEELELDKLIDDNLKPKIEPNNLASILKASREYLALLKAARTAQAQGTTAGSQGEGEGGEREPKAEP